jgi:hypothetical protein
MGLELEERSEELIEKRGWDGREWDGRGMGEGWERDGRGMEE